MAKPANKRARRAARAAVPIGLTALKNPPELRFRHRPRPWRCAKAPLPTAQDGTNDRRHPADPGADARNPRPPAEPRATSRETGGPGEAGLRSAESRLQTARTRSKTPRGEKSPRRAEKVLLGRGEGGDGRLCSGAGDEDGTALSCGRDAADCGRSSRGSWSAFAGEWPASGGIGESRRRVSRTLRSDSGSPVR